jgi:hypothetical protein
VGWEAVAKIQQCSWSPLQGAANRSAGVGIARQSSSNCVSNGGLDGRLETRKLVLGGWAHWTDTRLLHKQYYVVNTTSYSEDKFSDRMLHLLLRQLLTSKRHDLMGNLKWQIAPLHAHFFELENCLSSVEVSLS